jgi:uncharacterized BrkB/YihY/UPF0761 family membrane protein
MWEFFRFDLRYQLRAPLFWIGVLVFGLAAYGAMATDDIILGQAIGNVHRNAPNVIINMLTTLTIMGMFLAAAFIGNPVLRDHEFKIADLFHTSPMRPHQYLYGRFLAGLVISRGDVQSYLTEQLSDWLGIDADDIARALTDALDGTGTLTGLGILGAVSLFLTASVLVVAVQDAFNTIWERPVKPGLRHTVMRRLVAFAVIAGAGAVATVVVDGGVAAAERFLTDRADGSGVYL